MIPEIYNQKPSLRIAQLQDELMKAGDSMAVALQKATYTYLDEQWQHKQDMLEAEAKEMEYKIKLANLENKGKL